jgi:type IV pilus assembly protein PilC
MPAYVFKGKTRTGAPASGERTGDSKDAVIAMLRREQILVTSVKEKGKEIALPKFGGGIKPKQVAIFTRQFSVMIDAGLPLVQCLEILGSQQDNPNFQRVLLQVRHDVEGGSSLADAMKKHPKVFDDLFTNMIAAGEAGGILDTILKRLAVYIEKAVKLKSQVKSALVYPAAVISIAVLVVGVILWKVIPRSPLCSPGSGRNCRFPPES